MDGSLGNHIYFHGYLTLSAKEIGHKLESKGESMICIHNTVCTAECLQTPLQMK